MSDRPLLVLTLGNKHEKFMIHRNRSLFEDAIRLEMDKFHDIPKNTFKINCNVLIPMNQKPNSVTLSSNHKNYVQVSLSHGGIWQITVKVHGWVFGLLKPME